MVEDKHPGKEVADNSELERALTLLKPAASQIDRDSFLFMAGRASAEPAHPGSVFGRWMWPTATFLSSAAAVVLGLLFATRPETVASRPGSVDVATDRSIAPVIRDTAVRETANAGIENSANQHDQPPASSGVDSTGWDLAQSTAQADSSQALPSREMASELGEGRSYPRLRTFVLAYGINALPEPAPVQASVIGPNENEPRTQLEMLRQSRKGDRKGTSRFGGPADSAG